MTQAQYLSLAQKYKEEQTQLSENDMNRQYAAYNSQNALLSTLYEKRQALLNEPLNAARISKDPKAATQITGETDKQISDLESSRDTLGNRLHLDVPMKTAAAAAGLPAPTLPDHVTVQFPDSRGIMQIPATSLAAFRNKYPKALFKAGESQQSAAPQQGQSSALTPWQGGPTGVTQGLTNIAHGAEGLAQAASTIPTIIH